MKKNLLLSTNINFDVITTRKTRIPKNVSITQNIVLNNYSFKHTPILNLQQEKHFCI